jgi:hypothetical protein
MNAAFRRHASKHVEWHEKECSNHIKVWVFEHTRKGLLLPASKKEALSLYGCRFRFRELRSDSNDEIDQRQFCTAVSNLWYRQALKQLLCFQIGDYVDDPARLRYDGFARAAWDF